MAAAAAAAANQFKIKPFHVQWNGKKRRNRRCRDEDKNTSRYSYGVVEALLDQMEEDRQLVGEVMRIKGIVDENKEASDKEVYNSLRKLQFMDLPAATLIETKVGRSVVAIQNHASKEVSRVARSLVKGWKETVNGWMDVTEEMVVREGTGTNCNDSCEGLPCPPLEDFAFVYPHTTSQDLELSTFFDFRIPEDGKTMVVVEKEVKRPDNYKSRAFVERKLEKYDDKVEATKRKVQEAYERVKCRKRQRRTQVIELHDFFKQGLVC